jgi:hypothetical protein
MTKEIEHPNMFDFMNQIFYKKKTYPYDKKICNSYLLLMWLSHDPQLMPYIHKINHLQWYVPDDTIYEYLMDVIPKGKRFIKWDKKTAEDKKRQKKIEEIMSETRLSKREAMNLLNKIERLENVN